MNIKKLVDINSRLAKRHQLLVAEHLNATDTLSARLRALPDKSTSFASTQAAWCFYKNASHLNETALAVINGSSGRSCYVL